VAHGHGGSASSLDDANAALGCVHAMAEFQLDAAALHGARPGQTLSVHPPVPAVGKLGAYLAASDGASPGPVPPPVTITLPSEYKKGDRVRVRVRAEQPG